MDVNDLRVVVTVLSFIAFIGIVAWVWSSRNRDRFDEASRLPFADTAGSNATPTPPPAGSAAGHNEQLQPDTRR